MNRFIRYFLPTMCLLGACLLLGERARAEEPSIGTHGRIRGFGCDTPDDAKLLVVVAYRGGDRKQIEAAAAAAGIRCELFDGEATYAGAVEDSEFSPGRAGEGFWRVILFVKDDGNPLYAPEWVPTSSA